MILDEPFSGLDPVNIELFKRTVLRLKKEGTTILFSSHRMEDVEELCDKIVMLKKGVVIENDTVTGLIQKYSRDNEKEIETDRDISKMVEKNNLSLVKRENMKFTVVFDNKIDLQNLYSDILKEGIKLKEVHSNKVSMQSIFIKELSDNEK